MGESNCAWNRRQMIHRETLASAAAIYKGNSECDDNDLDNEPICLNLA